MLQSQNLIKINTKIKQKPLYTKLNNFLDESITFDQEKISKIVNISCKLASELDNWFFYFIKNFISKYTSTNNIDYAIHIETLFTSQFLKKNESENSYEKFYSALKSAYKNVPIQKLETNNKLSKGVLFVVHTPYFLAHIEPLKLLLSSNTKKYNEKNNISIITLSGFNKLFIQTFKDLGVNTFSLDKIFSISEKIKTIGLLKQRLKSKHIVWQCCPVGLTYATKVLPNINWWSLKFHPNIHGIKHYIGDISSGKDFIINKRKWKKFKASAHFKNLNSKPNNFFSRKKLFGCFCREELIDNEYFWLNIKLILSNNLKTMFCYTGRTSVHLHWIKKLGINSSQILFLGWLDEPHEYIKKCAFLIDPFPWGHGLMAREAILASIPILYKEHSKLEEFSPIQKILAGNKRDYTKIKKTKKKFSNTLLTQSTNYNSRKDLIHKAKLLFNNETYNIWVGKAYKRLLLNTKDFSGEGWNAFQKILDSSNF